MAQTEEATEAEEEQDDGHPLDDENTLRALYHGDELVEGGATQTQIGEEYGVTASTVSHYMKKHEVETRSSQRVTDERLDDAEWLEDAYHGDALEEGGATMQQIADEVGCSDGTVMRRLRKHGVIEAPDEKEEAAEDDEEEDDEE